MIGFLSGTVRDKYPVIISIRDVGYIVHVPEQTNEKLIKDQPYELYIHTHVREDALDLYGFLTKEELNLFELLLTVSGIGPRTGLNILNRGVMEIEKAVRESDVDFFTMVPRLGKKNAQKIIIELKNKLGSVSELNLNQTEGETKEAMEALISMGFTRGEVLVAIRKLTKQETTVEQKIRKALQLIGSKTT